MTETHTPAVAETAVETVTTAAPSSSGTLVTTLPAQEMTGWPAAAHLSPVAAFQTDRVGICTSYQLAAVDNTTATAHVDAALRHIRAAADSAGDKDDKARVVTTLRTIQAELYRVARGVGFGNTL